MEANGNHAPGSLLGPLFALTPVFKKTYLYHRSLFILYQFHSKVLDQHCFLTLRYFFIKDLDAMIFLFNKQC